MNFKGYHTPVLTLPLLEHFAVDESSVVFDGTLGFGGHADMLLSHSPRATYIGFDRDSFALENASKRCEKYENFKSVHASFSSMIKYLQENNLKLTHVLLDLGVSSYQIDESNRGFTFQKDEQLDMRMDMDSNVTAKELLQNYSIDELASMFINEGDIRRPDKLVSNIIERRNNNTLNTSFDLLECIKKSFYFKSRSHYIATATKVFQAIRVELNDEMKELRSILNDLLTLKNITVAIITFQPNEDRLVKMFIKENQLKFVQKKPFMASYKECKKNPREKSAKLRIFYI